MSKNHSGHRYRLLCRCENGACSWSTAVVVASDADATSELLLVLRAHADSFLHGPRIEGVAIGVINGDVTVIVLRHP